MPSSSQQVLTGTITKIDRINGFIAIQMEQSGTVGANTGGVVEKFKAQNDVSLDAVHAAGDKVTFFVTETAETKRVTNLQKQ